MATLYISSFAMAWILLHGGVRPLQGGKMGKVRGIIAEPIHFFWIKFSFLLIFYEMCLIVNSSTEGF